MKVSKVTVDIYDKGADQPKFDQVATDFDEARTDNDKIYYVDLPDGSRLFITIQLS